MKEAKAKLLVTIDFHFESYKEAMEAVHDAFFENDCEIKTVEVLEVWDEKELEPSYDPKQDE